jgi:WD40 repeat protein
MSRNLARTTDSIFRVDTKMAKFLCAILITLLATTKVFAAENSDMLEHEVIHRSFSQTISAIAWSPDQTKIAVRGQGEFYLWDVVNDEQVWKTKGVIAGNRGLAFTTDGRFIIIPSVTNGEANFHPENYSKQTTLTFVSVQDGSKVKTLKDTETWKDGLPLNKDFALASDGSVIASILGNASGWVTLYNPGTGNIVGHVGRMINSRGKPYYSDLIALDSRNKVVAISDPVAEVQIWDYEKNKKLSDFRASKTGIDALAFNPVSGELITGGDGVIMGAIVTEDGHIGPGGIQDERGTFVRAWNPWTGDLIRIYRGARYGVSSVAVSPDGRYVAATSGGPRVGVSLLLWQADNGALLKTIDYGSQDGRCPVNFSPDGKLLATAIDDKLSIYEVN